MKKHLKFLCLITLIFAICAIVLPVSNIFALDDGFMANYGDIENFNANKSQNGFVKAVLSEKEKSVDDQKTRSGEVVFKLFGIIPIKKCVVNMSDDSLYYVGGVPIGIRINSQGAIVVSDENGDNVLKEGDIIMKINSQDVESLDQIQEILQSCGDEVEVEILRKNKPLKTLLKTTSDQSGRLKLGIWVKDDISGIGTLTFVNKDTGEYGALGHPIVEANSQNIVPVMDGKIYPCNLIGINKGKKNAPGELKCVFLSSQKSKGDIKSNSKFGINGTLDDVEGLVDENVTAKLGGRLGVKMGKAKIVSTISGIREEYDIEIIKANYQKSAHDKSLVFRVTDKRLLALTGGIVQGMSGSPIMQDGKIIGAVTHVFLNDPTKGYGVYSDFMLKEKTA